MLHSEAGDTAAVRAHLAITRCLVALPVRGSDTRCPLYEESRYVMLSGPHAAIPSQSARARLTRSMTSSSTRPMV
jgi:hypothetical protein